MYRLNLHHALRIAGATLLAWSAAAAAAQNTTPTPARPTGDCGSSLRPEDLPAFRQRLQAGRYRPPAIAGGPGGEAWVVPLTIHIVRQSDGSGGLPEQNVDACVAAANAFYAPANIRFVRPLPTRFIDSDDFYFNIDTQAEIDALRSTDVICGTINVYFTENLFVEDGPDPDNDPESLCGQASFTWHEVQGITMANQCTGTSQSDNTTFTHELGHYFDLLHTHETANGVECVDGSNCDEAGDAICDTPADPQLGSSNMNMNCQYTGTMRDPCNNDLYNPQTWNLMSYATPRSCRTDFTPIQRGVANAVVATVRLAQWAPDACGCGRLVWADRNASEPFQGTQAQPYDTLAEALAHTCTGGLLILRSSYYAEAPRVISQRVTLTSSGGLVVIGP